VNCVEAVYSLFNRLVTRLSISRSQTTRKQDTQTLAFCFCDFDVVPMTLIYEFDLDILKMYLHNKNEVLNQGFEQDRQAD